MLSSFRTEASSPDKNQSTQIGASKSSEQSVIGQGLKIVGNLFSQDQLQVHGTVEGDIQGANVLIGENGRITGNMTCSEVIVRGSVIGSITSDRIVLENTAKIEGDLSHKSLAIEQGAIFEGKSRRMT